MGRTYLNHMFKKGRPKWVAIDLEDVIKIVQSKCLKYFECKLNNDAHIYLVVSPVVKDFVLGYLIDYLEDNSTAGFTAGWDWGNGIINDLTLEVIRIIRSEMVPT